MSDHSASANADQSLVSDGAATHLHPSGFDPSRGEPDNCDRPSAHGAVLGRLLTAMMEAGGGAETCATCAFRPGSLANLSAGTGLVAMHCALGTDPSDFGCHHGMKDGEPSHLCAGFLAAKRAPFQVWKAGIASIAESIPADENDPIRADFDQWRKRLDPNFELDVYQLGRAYARRDSDEHRNGEDPKGLSAEGMPARAEGIAQPSPSPSESNQ